MSQGNWQAQGSGSGSGSILDSAEDDQAKLIAGLLEVVNEGQARAPARAPAQANAPLDVAEDDYDGDEGAASASVPVSGSGSAGRPAWTWNNPSGAGLHASHLSEPPLFTEESVVVQGKGKGDGALVCVSVSVSRLVWGSPVGRRSICRSHSSAPGSTSTPAAAASASPVPNPEEDRTRGLSSIVDKTTVKDEERRVVEDVRMVAVYGDVHEFPFLEEEQLTEYVGDVVYRQGLEHLESAIVTVISEAAHDRMRALIESLCELAAMRAGSGSDQSGIRGAYSTRSKDQRDNPRRMMIDAEAAVGPGGLPPAPVKSKAKSPAKRLGVRAAAEAAGGALGQLALQRATMNKPKSGGSGLKRGRGAGSDDDDDGDDDGDYADGLLPATTVKHADRRIGMRDASVVLLRDMASHPIRRQLVVKALSGVESGVGVGLDG